MYEFSVARKYLIPRVRQLSFSCISLISVTVIALVVWLSIVFFSAQEGIERRWTEKMIALTAPIRLTPTDKYFQSYYYQIDSYSSSSNFAYKSLSDKLLSGHTDPFDPENDPSLPRGLVKQDDHDIVKETYQILIDLHLRPSIYETAHATVNVLMKDARITQVAYIMPFDEQNPLLEANIQPSTLKTLPENAIILPKNYREAGVSLHDTVTLTTEGFGAVGSSQVRLTGFVAGFYDPGIIPIGGKVILASNNIVKALLSASIGDEQLLPSGFNIHGMTLHDVGQEKSKIVDALAKSGLSSYWKVETYKEYEFTKDIFQQMQSDKNLFSLIAFIIIVVASSNIVSMLIILVHDKKKEIAIMQALGATKKSIALIFGFSGFCMGAAGAIVGSLLAVITLKNLEAVLAFLGHLQGFEVLNQSFYGNSLPTEVSGFAILFVLGLCATASSLAGIIASISACRINTSEALRNE